MRKVCEVYLVSSASSDERGVELTFPVSQYEMMDAFEQIHTKSPGDVYWQVDEFYCFDYLAPHLDESMSIFEFNSLTEQLSKLDERQETALEGLLQMQVNKHMQENSGIITVPELMMLASNVDRCQVLADVNTDEALGKFYVENGFREDLDALQVHGNGSSINVLMDAGVTSADLVIAVTGSDELNLLCCLVAKNLGKCHTVARVRNPIYNKEINLMKESLGISMIINPEMATAAEIARLLRFPSAIKIDPFAKGKVELLKFRLKPEFRLDGKSIVEINMKGKHNILVAGVERGEQVFIPNGDFEFRAGDTVAIASERRNAIDFFRKIGIVKNRVSNAILAGGGKVSFYLAKILIQSGIRVTIIEINPSRCDVLSELLPEATIICGDATDQDLLSEEGLEQAQGFAALTGLDEENILLSLYANDVSNAKTVTKINRSSFNSVINEMNLGSIIYPRVITADYILKYVRSTVNSINSNVETLYKLAGGKAEALEFIIKENSAVAGIPLQDLNFRKNTLICCIYRNGKVILPGGQDMMLAGDSVLVVISGYRISDIKEILED